MIFNKMRVTKAGLVLAAFGVLMISLLNASRVDAQYYVPKEDKRAISVDKKIRPIDSENYYDNISSDVAIFFDGDTLEFKVSVENIGNETLSNIKVEDQLPANLALVFYPGELNKVNNVITWTIDKLEVGEVKNFLIRARISEANKLVNLNKRTNVANVSADGLSDKDDASYFIGVKSVPKTGDPTIILKTVMVVMGTVAGLGLRKVSRGY